MKIQINSLEALERLIGGDTEVEIDIRNSVVQEFTKKHLKAIADDDLVKLAQKATETHIRQSFFTLKNKTWGYGQEYVFNKEMEEKILGDLKYQVENHIRELVFKTVETEKVDKIIKDKLAWAVKHIENQLTEQNLEKRLEEMVQKRLKEKLGL